MNRLYGSPDERGARSSLRESLYLERAGPPLTALALGGGLVAMHAYWPDPEQTEITTLAPETVPQIIEKRFKSVYGSQEFLLHVPRESYLRHRNAPKISSSQFDITSYLADEPY